MCGRFVLTTDPTVIQTAFHLASVPAELPARYNVAPTQPVAVITNDDPTALVFHRWGLIPSWAKDMSVGSKMINARSESVDEKPSFRAAFKRRRCLILADGFYEWQVREGEKAKTPMFIHLKGQPVFAFAGLWEIWRSPEDEEVRSCTILTTEANPFIAAVHHRMPVILAPEDYETWLSADKPEVVKALLQPYDPEQMTYHAVSRKVNSVANDTPDLLQPVA
jgi:putative SOS response-associated peptidase YedK